MVAPVNRITEQCIYAGPTAPQLGLSYGTIYQAGCVPDQMYNIIAACPAVGALFIPVTEYAAARKELNFDIARNMRGTQGKFPRLYREVQNWLTGATKQPSSQVPKPKGVKIKHHA